MKKILFYRAWFYFRTGWSVYLTFVFAAVNTITVTYYLAIENISFLKDIFSSLEFYILTVSAIGIPTVVVAGYIHYKRSSAYTAEADIAVETNPHFRRMLLNTEITLSLYAKLSDLLIKISENAKLTDDEKKELTAVKKEVQDYLEKKTVNFDKEFNSKL